MMRLFIKIENIGWGLSVWGKGNEFEVFVDI